jgi:hypothetical protein
MRTLSSGATGDAYPIGFVGHHHFLVALHHGFKFLAVMHVGAGQRNLPDQRVCFIHRHMHLVTIVRWPCFTV